MPVKPVAEEPSATSLNAFTGGHEKEKEKEKDWSFRSSCFMVVMGCVEMRKETPRLLLSAAGDPALTRYKKVKPNLLASPVQQACKH
jgi:hypothetical protein